MWCLALTSRNVLGSLPIAGAQPLSLILEIEL